MEKYNQAALAEHRQLIGKVVSLEIKTTVENPTVGDPDGIRVDEQYVTGTLIGIGWETRGPWILYDTYHFTHGTVKVSHTISTVELTVA